MGGNDTIGSKGALALAEQLLSPRAGKAPADPTDRVSRTLRDLVFTRRGNGRGLGPRTRVNEATAELALETAAARTWSETRSPCMKALDFNCFLDLAKAPPQPGRISDLARRRRAEFRTNRVQDKRFQVPSP